MPCTSSIPGSSRPGATSRHCPRWPGGRPAELRCSSPTSPDTLTPMTWQVWLAFFGAAIVISVSPGAGAVQSMATGLTHGVRRGYWNILGLEIGLMLQLALVAIGLGAAVTHSIVAFNVIKWLGVAYLIYLAVR